MDSVTRTSRSTLREPPTTAGRELVLRTIAAHAPSLLGTARRYSLCADDAQDAYQRALEIFLRRADSVDPERAVGWLRTVLKHEAMAVRAGRLRLVGAGEVDLDREEALELNGAEERAADREHAEQAAEALGRLKPQEIRALVLKARGYSYQEIAEICGWTYTKVNRCLTEGRRAFLDRYEAIAAGRECERWASSLSALADGEASADDVAALRPHLRACAGCRAALRGFRAAPGAAAALAPLAVVAPGDGAPGLLARVWDALNGGLPALHERAAAGALKLQAGVEAASTGKVAAVAASATALAGGGLAAVERSRLTAAPAAHAARRVALPRPPRPARHPSAFSRVTDVASRSAPPPRPRAARSGGTAALARSQAASAEFGPEGSVAPAASPRRPSREATGSAAVATSRAAPVPSGASAPSAAAPASDGAASASTPEFSP